MHKVPMPGQELGDVVNWTGQLVFLQMKVIQGQELHTFRVELGMHIGEVIVQGRVQTEH